MIDINLYIHRIGLFNPKSAVKRLKDFKICGNQDSRHFGRNLLGGICSLAKVILLLALLGPACLPLSPVTAAPGTPPGCCPCLSSSSPSRLSGDPSSELAPRKYFVITGKKETKNFLAKYVNGNRKKGILNLHLNIRSLKNKVPEVKNLIKEHNPDILGLSECELRKIGGQFNETQLKVPGYKILFPKSWSISGVARVVVYVKNNFEHEQVHDLEDEQVQAVWIRGGFKKCKKIYFCHGYREHTNSMGNSLSAQRANLELFLSQWEAPTEHNNATEPNETHICCDTNLDSLDGRWLTSGYSLISLSRLVQSCCSMNNFSRMVKEVTRIQFNNVANTTVISCIDHIYTNSKYRCSAPKVMPFGNSDHDVISYYRYSKEPSAPTRTIRKRSYKNFNVRKYKEDLACIDWTDVMCCDDLDLATEIFTRKLRWVLNVHAPWIIFQQRKSFTPWITENTKKLMIERNQLKQKARDLALRDQGGQVSEEQKGAWAEFKKVRNKINNMKKKDERVYKSNKINEGIDSPAKVWGTAKNFMGWKSVGTPHQLEVQGRLESKAGSIAKIMNNFFVDKVQKIRRSLGRIPHNFQECKNIMFGKRCSLRLQYTSKETVRKLLMKLKSSKSISVDELDNFSVKHAAEFIADPLHHIITLSIMQSKFPESWKFYKLFLSTRNPVN